MTRLPTLALLLGFAPAAGLVPGLPAATADEAYLADLVARSARWLGRARGFAELRDTALVPELLREVLRLTLVRHRGDGAVVARVLDAVPVSTHDTPRQLARKVLRRAGALPPHERIDFLGLVARVVPPVLEETRHDRTVDTLLTEGAPPSPFMPVGPAGARVATDAQLEDLAFDILDSLWKATLARAERRELPLEVVADRLLEE